MKIYTIYIIVVGTNYGYQLWLVPVDILVYWHVVSTYIGVFSYIGYISIIEYIGRGLRSSIPPRCLISFI